MAAAPKLSPSYGIKKPYSSPLSHAIFDIMMALRMQNSTEALNQELILLETMPRDMQAAFKDDIEKLRTLLLEDSIDVTGANTYLATEHAARKLKRIGFQNRGYAHTLWARIIQSLDQKKWLEQPLVVGEAGAHIGEQYFEPKP